MSETYTVGSMSELISLLKKHTKQREQRINAATRRAASKGRAFVKRNVPVAFGEIRESVHAEGPVIVVDAPHAAAVNNGSRPHWAPLAPLVAWVKQRGMQGLLSDRQLGRLPGTTTKSSALGVAAMLRSHEIDGTHSPVDAAEQVARAIQRAIASKGTKPHHFIEKTLPELRRLLGEELRAAMEGEGEGGGTDGGGGGSSGGGAKKATSSGFYRKNVDTYRGSPIRTDAHGNRSVTLKNGKTIHLQH